jgi:hypothetical protein
MPDDRARVFGDEIDAAVAIVKVEDHLSNGVVVDFVGLRCQLPRDARDRALGCRKQRSVLPSCFSNRMRVHAHGSVLSLEGRLGEQPGRRETTRYYGNIAKFNKSYRAHVESRSSAPTSG